MKKLIILCLVTSLFTSSCTSDKEVTIPFNVTKQYTEGKFDTLLLIKDADATYYFNPKTKDFTHKVQNSMITTTEEKTPGIAIVFLLVILFILLSLLFA